MSNTGYKGMNNPASGASEFNALSFLVTQILNRQNTATLVQVKAVTNSGGVSPVGYVDVQPLVAQLDGHGNAVPHGVIHNIPYFRLQGGTDAVIIDPKQDDIGICIFASHDISSVKSAKGAATPGSKRRFDMADGLYMGGVLNGTPQQYIRFASDGIYAVSPTKIICEAPEVDVQASSAANVTAPAINLGASGQSLQAMVTAAFESFFNQHVHSNNGAGAPTVPMGASHLTTTVKGG